MTCIPRVVHNLGIRLLPHPHSISLKDIGSKTPVVWVPSKHIHLSIYLFLDANPLSFALIVGISAGLEVPPASLNDRAVLPRLAKGNYLGVVA